MKCKYKFFFIGENIRIVIDDVDTRRQQQQQFHQSTYERVILRRDDREQNTDCTRGFGLIIVGGKLNPDDGSLYSYVKQVIPGGSAAKMGVIEGDKVSHKRN